MPKIHTEVLVNKDKEKVWQEYTNPESIKNWAFASDDWECPKASNDLKVGGKFLTRMQSKDGNYGFDFTGTYREVENLEKITYVMDKASSEEKSRGCEITFEDVGNDLTRVIVVFDSENENPIEMQKNGWQAILDNFKKYIESL